MTFYGVLRDSIGLRTQQTPKGKFAINRIAFWQSGSPLYPSPPEETTFPKLHERTQERKEEHRASSEDSGWWFKKRLEDLERAPRSEIVRVHLETTEQKLAMRDFLGEVASSLFARLANSGTFGSGNEFNYFWVWK